MGTAYCAAQKDATISSYRSRIGDSMNGFDEDMDRAIGLDNSRDGCRIIGQCVQCSTSASCIGKD